MFIFHLAIVLSFLNMRRIQTDLQSSYASLHEISALTTSHHYISAKLTQLSRAYAVTRSPDFRDAYEALLGYRRGTITFETLESTYGAALSYGLDISGLPAEISSTPLSTISETAELTRRERDWLDQAILVSDHLARREQAVMALVDSDARNDGAIMQLFDKDYERRRAEIMMPLQRVAQSLSARIQAEITSSERSLARAQAGFIAVLALSFLVVTLFAVEIHKQTRP